MFLLISPGCLLGLLQMGTSTVELCWKSAGTLSKFLIYLKKSSLIFVIQMSYSDEDLFILPHSPFIPRARQLEFSDSGPVLKFCAPLGVW